jgi:hypothetical protein
MSVSQLEPVSRYLSPDQIALRLAVHHNTVIRWLRDGVRFSDGKRRRPEAIRTPGGWRILEDHLFEFLESVKADRTRQSGDVTTEVKKPANSPRVERMNVALVGAGF